MNELSNSVLIRLRQKLFECLAVCGENVCVVKTQTCIEWASENEMVLILYVVRSTDQTCAKVPSWLNGNRQVPVSLNSQAMTAASKPAETTTVAGILHRLKC